MKHKIRSESSKQASTLFIINDQQPHDSCKRRKTTTSAKETEKGDRSTTGRKIQQLHSSYPNVSVLKKEILETCPGSYNNCHCKSCMPEIPNGYSCAENEKFQFSKHNLRGANEEQLMEKELDANLKALCSPFASQTRPTRLLSAASNRSG
ncbi:uncharacterized protein [Rutidosis leptorrhynchoides]|uniref:uncharacterized protein n=1 Tax=Rutidosis leptorrhynchoides TaxID=125765 RepID=UPI003A99F21E